MKTLVLLLAGILITASAIAADMRPTVTVSNRSKYKIYIDDRHYSDRDNHFSLSHLGNGRHTIKVYEDRGGLFGGRKLVSSKAFTLRNNEVRITVNNNGRITMNNTGGYRNDRNDRDDRWGKDRGRDDNDWNKRDKNKKWKHKKNRGRDDNDWNKGRGNGRGRY